MRKGEKAFDDGDGLLLLPPIKAATARSVLSVRDTCKSVTLRKWWTVASYCYYLFGKRKLIGIANLIFAKVKSLVILQ